MKKILLILMMVSGFAWGNNSGEPGVNYKLSAEGKLTVAIDLDMKGLTIEKLKKLMMLYSTKGDIRGIELDFKQLRESKLKK